MKINFEHGIEYGKEEYETMANGFASFFSKALDLAKIGLEGQIAFHKSQQNHDNELKTLAKKQELELDRKQIELQMKLDEMQKISDIKMEEAKIQHELRMQEVSERHEQELESKQSWGADFQES